ncbi:hypothetical protein V1511DRAFT_513488 [Dipodascopsis uninucleata]
MADTFSDYGDASDRLYLSSRLLSSEEYNAYPRWFAELVPKDHLTLTLDEIMAFCDRFGLSEQDKWKIFDVFDTPINTLEKGEFYVFMRLVAHLLNGRLPTKKLAFESAPVPKPDGYDTSMINNKQASAYISSSASSSSASLSTPTEASHPLSAPVLQSAITIPLQALPTAPVFIESERSSLSSGQTSRSNARFNPFRKQQMDQENQRAAPAPIGSATTTSNSVVGLSPTINRHSMDYSRSSLENGHRDFQSVDAFTNLMLTGDENAVGRTRTSMNLSRSSSPQRDRLSSDFELHRRPAPPPPRPRKSLNISSQNISAINSSPRSSVELSSPARSEAPTILDSPSSTQIPLSLVDTNTKPANDVTTALSNMKASPLVSAGSRLDTGSPVSQKTHRPPPPPPRRKVSGHRHTQSLSQLPSSSSSSIVPSSTKSSFESRESHNKISPNTSDDTVEITVMDESIVPDLLADLTALQREVDALREQHIG